MSTALALISEFFNFFRTSLAFSKGNVSVNTSRFFSSQIFITCSMSFIEPINVPRIVFSSNAKNDGFLPTVAITMIPPFFTALMAVSVTISAGANTIAASSNSMFLFDFF